MIVSSVFQIDEPFAQLVIVPCSILEPTLVEELSETESLISDILGEQVKVKTTDLNRHLDIKIAEQKLGVMDLRTELDDGTKCNIEIQLDTQKNENERFLYYWADVYSRQLPRGEEYDKLHKTISIVILDHEIKELKEINELGTKWQIRDNKTGKKLLTDHLEIIIVEIPKAIRQYKNNENNKICQWMMFLDNPNNRKEMNDLMENWIRKDYSKGTAK